MDYFAALAYQIGNGNVKARFSVFLTVPSFAWSYSKLFLTETLEIMHRKPVYIYSEAIKSIQLSVLNIRSYVHGCFKIIIFAKRLAFQNTSANFFAGINNVVMVPYLNSIVPIKSRFVHGKRYSSLNKSLALVAMSKTISLFNQNPPPNDFNMNSKFFLSQIISVSIKMIWN